MYNYDEICSAVEKGRAREISALITAAMGAGVAADEILNLGLLAGMNIVGEKFRENKVFVPEVMLAARALNIGLDLLRPALASEGATACGRAVICTVNGDRHDIGKNLVKMMLQGAGFEVVDLGVSVSEEKIVAAVSEHKPDIVALSALLTTTMKSQATTIEALIRAGLRDSVKVMVGGAPVTARFAEEIGADAYTKDAAEAASVARSFVAL